MQIYRSIEGGLLPSTTGGIPARGAAAGSLTFDGLEVYDRERRQGDGEHVGSPVPADRRRFHTAEIAQSTAAILRGVAVQHLAPDAAAGDADAVVVARHRREVEHGEDDLRWVGPDAQEAECALRGVVDVAPFEARGVVVASVKRRLFAVKTVQVSHPALDLLVACVVREVPLQAAVVVPLRPLAELGAHEQELLARLTVHVAV